MLKDESKKLCHWCGEKVNESEGKEENELGFICNHCIDTIKARGTKLSFKDSVEFSNLRAALEELNKPMVDSDGEVWESEFDFDFRVEDNCVYIYDKNENYSYSYLEDLEWIGITNPVDDVKPKLLEALKKDGVKDPFIDWETSVRMVCCFED